jgi:hypothetical protein
MTSKNSFLFCRRLTLLNFWKIKIFKKSWLLLLEKKPLKKRAALSQNLKEMKNSFSLPTLRLPLYFKMSSTIRLLPDIVLTKENN